MILICSLKSPLLSKHWNLVYALSIVKIPLQSLKSSAGAVNRQLLRLVCMGGKADLCYSRKLPENIPPLFTLLQSREKSENVKISYTSHNLSVSWRGNLVINVKQWEFRHFSLWNIKTVRWRVKKWDFRKIKWCDKCNPLRSGAFQDKSTNA